MSVLQSGMRRVLHQSGYLNVITLYKAPCLNRYCEVGNAFSCLPAVRAICDSAHYPISSNNRKLLLDMHHLCMHMGQLHQVVSVDAH